MKQCVVSCLVLTGGFCEVSARQKRGNNQAAPILCDDLSSAEGSNTSAWFYDWNIEKGSFGNSGCGTDLALHPNAEYVPQFSTYWTLNPPMEDMNLTYVSTAKFVMGYNEPDHDGSIVPPEFAASQWARMEELQDAFGFQVVSPCVANYVEGREWLYEFQGNCSALYGRPCKYDFSCVHAYYQPTAIESMMGMLEQMYNDWKLPIWVTEFACPPYQQCSAETQLEFMSAAVPLIDELPYIYRYAWFISRMVDEEKGGCVLLQGPLPNVTTPQRTPLGEWYNTFESLDNDESKW